jgi:phenylalanyl-tRNA synthetase beta chain
MIVSVDWLKNFVDIDDDLEVLSETLSNLGLESEVLPIPKKIPGVKIAKVEKIVKHPNADKLQLCDIYDGVKINKVICGAPNIEAGQIVAFAMVGSTLPGDLKIKKSNIRGIDSFGMVCSEKELNLSEEHDGIMVLPQELTVGEDFDLAYGYKFVAINIDITPNRPDALCYLGVARDISCFKNIALNKIKINKIKPKLSKNIQVSIEDFSDCPRYIAGVINNIKVEKSPDWIIERLKSSGLRSINNVVDISNIVMLEMGHPSHIFDFESIDTNNIYVR